MLPSMTNTIWMLVCVGLVFAMQGGFLCLESGLTRSKDAINVALKNMADFSISLLAFWAFGYGLMFGISYGGWFGTTEFFLRADRTDPQAMTRFLFQAMFCATSATIVSGATAGRMRFSAYLLVTLIVSGIVYPLFGHWAWSHGEPHQPGWLADLGFADFAGATVVHGVGGWAALAAAVVIGPRLGQHEGQDARKQPGSNLPFAMLGAMLLWLGWIGFNGGSALVTSGLVPGIIANTLLAGSAGMLCTLVATQLSRGSADVYLTINGSLAGLVSITAGCQAVSTTGAVVIGSIGALVMLGSERLLAQCRVDDAIGAVSVHGAAGVWGTVSVAIFGNPEVLGTGLSAWEQLQIQVTGVLVAFLATFGTTYVVLRLVSTFHALRVSPEEERLGLNVVEHDAETELNELIREMDEHRESGDFSRPVSVESYSEVGQIGAQYNRVLRVINDERRQLIQANVAANQANAELRSARNSIEDQLSELAEFNEMAVDRELRMVELKQEINALCEELDEPPRYDMLFDDADLLVEYEP